MQMLRSQDFTSAAARDVLEVFAPLADQLGVWSLKAELEDLAFQVPSAMLPPPALRLAEILWPALQL